MGTFPVQGSTPWGDDLKTYINDRGVADAAPAGAGGNTRTKVFDAKTSSYNLKRSNMRRFSAAYGKALAGIGLCEIMTIGDSITDHRSGPNTSDHLGMWPLVARNIMAARENVPLGGDGAIFAGHAGPAGQDATSKDPRVTLGGGTAYGTDFATLDAAGKTISFTSVLPATTLDIGIYGTGVYSYSIDGATAVNVTGTNGSAPTKTTVTGLTNAVHTVVLTRVSGATYVIGVNFRQTSGLVVQNIAQYGTITTNNAQFGWTSGTTGFTNQAFRESTSRLWSPDPALVTVMLGINDLGSSGLTGAQVVTNTGLILDRFPNSDKMIVIPPQPRIVSVSQVNWDALVSGLYSLADTRDIALLDGTDILGGAAWALSSGLSGDNYHPTPEYQRMVGKAFAGALASI